MEYIVVYSKRKTLAITIKKGEVIVRSPVGLKRKEIDYYVNENSDWIEKHLKRSLTVDAKEPQLMPEEIKKMKAEAKTYFGDMLEHFSKIMGLKYERFSITSAKRRFGSCSESGNICFSYRLMMYPERAREYVVVHELAHLVEMNHSRRFYDIIERYMPDYKARKKLLKNI